MDQHPTMERAPCVCGSMQEPSRTIQARDEGSGDIFDYVTCPACSVERLSPRPTADEIGRYYPPQYAPHVGAVPQGQADQFKRLLYEVFWASNDEVRPRIRPYRSLLRLALYPFRNRTVLAFKPPAMRRVFEFGVARGTDLLAFKNAGWIAEGCEPSEQACALAASQGLIVQNATAETAVLAPDAYSCILFNNVFEHIHEPGDVLCKCHAALQAGGALILIVPNHDSLTGRIFGAAWPGYDAPRHTWAWTPNTIRQALSRAGLEVESIDQRASGAWLWRSTLDKRHAPDRPGKLRLWLSRWAAPLGVPVSVLFSLMGRGDFMRVVARKA